MKAPRIPDRVLAEPEPARARYPDQEGFAARDGVKIAYEVYGDGDVTVLLLPVWSIVHSRSWKGQIAYLARHHRVVTFDGRGNGKSDRPDGAEPYLWREYVADALAVMHMTETERAVLVGGSRLAAVPLGLAAGFLEWFFTTIQLTDPHSTRLLEQVVAWGLDTDPETLADTWRGPLPTEAEFTDMCGRVRCPVTVIHGTEDIAYPIEMGEALARATGGSLIALEGAGHPVAARKPVAFNLSLTAFISSLAVHDSTPVTA